MNEIWKVVKGYETYQCSNLGRFRKFFKEETGEMLETPIMEVVRLGKDGRNKVYLTNPLTLHCSLVHCDWFVATAFVPNINGNFVVRHLDGNLANDVITNLRWYTPEAPIGSHPVVGTNIYSGEESWYESSQAAAEDLDSTRQAINACVHGKVDAVRNLRFRYADSSYARASTSLSPIVAINIMTREETVFRSQSEAAKRLGIAQSHVSDVLRGKRKRVGDWTFRLVFDDK